MEISFLDIVRVLKKNIAFIIVLSLITAMGSFCITTFFVPKTYKTTVKLYVKSSYDTSSASESQMAYNYAKNLVATYIQMLDTNKFYSTVSKQLNEKYTATKLSSMISFTSVEDTEIFQAEVTSSDPTEAKNIADAIAATAPATISDINDNAQLKIVDEPVVPKSPTSPNTSKNTLIGFAIGLVLAIVISFVRDYFDVNIKYNPEMTTLAGLPVLAAIPDFMDFTNNRGEAAAAPKKA